MKTVIDSADKARFNFREIIAYSSLLRNLAYRDLTVRYKQTWMGMLWALIRPLVNIFIFGTLSILINRTSDSLENFLNIGSSIIVWSLITSCISDSSASLVANTNLLTKVYFPKIILPLSSVFVCLIDFVVAFVIYLIIFIFFKGVPGLHVLLLPLFLGLTLFFCVSLGFIFSTLNVKYRDVGFALPFILQFLFYSSPVFLTTEFYLEKLPNILKPIFLLNPLVFILDGFKYCLYGNWEVYDIRLTLASVFLMVFVFIFGLRYFLKFEKTFADNI